MLKKILSIAFIPISSVVDFSVFGESVQLRTSKEFYRLTSQPGKTTANVTSKISDAGCLYTIAISSKLLYRPLGLMQAVNNGCLILIRTADGAAYIYGCADFPLRGTVVRNVSPTAKDFSGFTLSLSGSQLHDALLLTDLIVE